MNPTPSAGVRIDQLDALRGLALLGIVLVNIGVFASPWWGSGVPDPIFADPLSRALTALVAALFELKFYLLFSFLFGYSFSLQRGAAERAGQAFAPRMGRRLLGLCAVGALHAALLFHGDILTTYALMGAALMALSRFGERAQLRIAHALILVTAAGWAALGALAWLTPAAADAAAAAQAQALLQGFAGSPAATIATRVDQLADTWPILLLLQAPCALAMFLYGAAAGRHRLAARLHECRALSRRLRIAGFGLGLPAALALGASEILAVSEPVALWILALSLLTAPLLSLAYAATALTWFAGAGARAAAWLAPAGRMALSNYLLQSAALAWLFTGYGPALIGRLPPAATMPIALALFVAQSWFSRWWLHRYAYGPLEWLLRALTIGAWPRLGPPAYARDRTV